MKLLVTLHSRHSDGGLGGEASQENPERKADLTGQRDCAEQSQDRVGSHRQSKALVHRILILARATTDAIQCLVSQEAG